MVASVATGSVSAHATPTGNRLPPNNNSNSWLQLQRDALIPDNLNDLIGERKKEDIMSLAGTGGTGPNTIVKEGWLMKRGEHIKTWRQRYFILRTDGTLMGYRSKPAENTPNTPTDQLLNNFTVRGCQIMSVDRPKPYTFIIRGLQWTTVIERTFAVETEAQRELWTEAIRNVASRLCEMGETAVSPLPQTDMTDVEMAALAEDELSTTLNEQFSLRGTTCNSSGVKKVVSKQCNPSIGISYIIYTILIILIPLQTLENFEFLKVLGKGTFGKVILCREKANAKLYAIKILKKEVIIQKDEVAHTLTESRVLKSTNHPFLIVSISGCIDTMRTQFHEIINP